MAPRAAPAGSHLQPAFVSSSAPLLLVLELCCSAARLIPHAGCTAALPLWCTTRLLQCYHPLMPPRTHSFACDAHPHLLVVPCPAQRGCAAAMEAHPRRCKAKQCGAGCGVAAAAILLEPPLPRHMAGAGGIPVEWPGGGMGGSVWSGGGTLVCEVAGGGMGSSVHRGGIFLCMARSSTDDWE